MSDPSQDEKPPLFSRWKTWYWLVMVVMFIQLALYLLITHSFS